MRKLFPFLAVLVVALPTFGGPTIATATRAAAPGATVTIEGACFGSVTPDYEWQNWEDQNVGEKLLYNDKNTPGMPNGWHNGINTDPGYGNTATVTDQNVYAGSRCIKLEMPDFGESDQTSSVHYKSSLDGRSSFSTIYASFNAYMRPLTLRPPGNPTYYVGQWKIFDVNNSDSLNDSHNDQEGGFYFTITHEPIGSTNYGQTSTIEQSWGFNDEGAWCCCAGDSTKTCPNGPRPLQCVQACKYVGFPGNANGDLSDAEVSNFEHFERIANQSGNLEFGNQIKDRDYTDNWFRFEYFWRCSSAPGERDAKFYVRVSDRASGKRPAFFQLDTDLMSHVAEEDLHLDDGEAPVSAVWAAEFKRVILKGYVGSLDLDSTLFYDDCYFAFGDDAESRVELGDKPYYADCTRFEIQPAATWADDEITFALNPGAWAIGQWKYLYVVDSTGTPNAKGWPIWIGNTAPPDEDHPPQKPGAPRFDEGLGEGE